MPFLIEIRSVVSVTLAASPSDVAKSSYYARNLLPNHFNTAKNLTL
jgi:hypothetical protein